MDRSLSFIIGQSKRDELAKLELLFAHSANRDVRQSWERAVYDGSGAPTGSTCRGSAPASPGVTDPRDHPGQCYLIVLEVPI